MDELAPKLAVLRFLATDEHLTRAAEHAGVPQPTVSRWLAALGEALGAPVVVRDGRRVRLTRAGRLLAESAERAVAALEAGWRAAAEEVDPERGQVALGFLHLLGRSLVPGLVRGFRNGHPAVRFRLVQDSRQVLLERLADGGVDLALIAPPPSGAEAGGGATGGAAGGAAGGDAAGGAAGTAAGGTAGGAAGGDATRGAAGTEADGGAGDVAGGDAARGAAGAEAGGAVGRLAWRVLRTQELVLVVHASHRLAARRRAVRVADLAGEAFVGLERGYGLRQITDELCAAAGFTPELAFEGQETETVRGLVSAGLGVAVLPAADHPTDLVELPLLPRAERRIALVWPTDHPLPPAVRVFRDHAINEHPVGKPSVAKPPINGPLVSDSPAG
ncbi:LysR substrate-binding domain-containing protein [Actinosynnema pretiosum]|uniref:LysR substrate-binding domain-containing protein n=1 Tax=Actinosynnema pretiosum TaxID=42197 RepID=UPI001E35B510|nr:LysR substrate-binding domain-containing protein [Actinosynnema pretiosum]